MQTYRHRHVSAAWRPRPCGSHVSAAWRPQHKRTVYRQNEYAQTHTHAHTHTHGLARARRASLCRGADWLRRRVSCGGPPNSPTRSQNRSARALARRCSGDITETLRQPRTSTHAHCDGYRSRETRHRAPASRPRASTNIERRLQNVWQAACKRRRSGMGQCGRRHRRVPRSAPAAPQPPGGAPAVARGARGAPSRAEHELRASGQLCKTAVNSTHSLHVCSSAIGGSHGMNSSFRTMNISLRSARQSQSTHGCASSCEHDVAEMSSTPAALPGRQETSLHVHDKFPR